MKDKVLYTSNTTTRVMKETSKQLVLRGRIGDITEALNILAEIFGNKPIAQISDNEMDAALKTVAVLKRKKAAG